MTTNHNTKLTLLVVFTISLSVTTHAGIPRGVFSMGQSSGGPSDVVLQNPDVTGVTIRWGWADIEATEGSFDYSRLDAQLDNVRDNSVNDKKVLLRISTQAGKPEWVTQAVKDAGGTFFTFDDNGTQTTIPVFWDPTFLEKKIAMIRDLGVHITEKYSDLVVIVSASFANATSEDWNVPHTPEEVAEWQSPEIDYTTEKLVGAGRQIIDATMNAFPNQYVSLAVNGNGPTLDKNVCPDLDNTCAASEAVGYANETYPNRLIVQIDSLSNCNPDAPGPEDSAWNLLWNSRPNVAAQMVDNVFGESNHRANCGTTDIDTFILTNCVNQGASYGINYIEIYETDVRYLPNVIAYAHDLLMLARVAPPPFSGWKWVP